MWLKIFKLALLSCLAIFFLSFLIHPLQAINQDLGRYFKVSQVILENYQVPDVNLFSYTQPDYHFINTHWLGGMFFYLLNMVIGLRALIVFKTLIVLIAFGIVFYLTWRKSRKRFWLSFFIGLLGIGIFIERTDVRPEIFSYLFLAISLYLFYFKSKTKWFWLIPLIGLIWVNTHIYFFILPSLYFFFLLDKLILYLTKKKISKAYLKKLFAIGLLLVLSLFINPNGAENVFQPIKSFFQGYGYTIIENQTPFFLLDYAYHLNIIYLFFFGAGLLIFSFLLNFKKIKLFNLLFALFLIVLGFSAVRNFPIFVLGTMPILAANLAPIWSKLNRRIKPNLYFQLYLIIALIICLLGGIYDRKEQINLKVEVKAKEAVDYVLENKLQGNMFNNFDNGGYLSYRFYPERKVFIDNRLLAYSKDFFQEIYIPMQQSREKWDKYAQEYQINYVLFEHTDITPWARKFLLMISQHPEWEKVYQDNYEVIYVKK